MVDVPAAGNSTISNRIPTCLSLTFEERDWTRVKWQYKRLFVNFTVECVDPPYRIPFIYSVTYVHSTICYFLLCLITLLFSIIIMTTNSFGVRKIDRFEVGHWRVKQNSWHQNKTYFLYKCMEENFSIKFKLRVLVLNKTNYFE